MKRAIVLSGGGARGSYQIGVWKALRKLHIKYDIVTGTSVGALNGALMTQKSYFRSIWLWYNINFKHIFKEAINDDFKTAEGRKAIIKKYARAILIDNGMDVSNLEFLINKAIDEKRISKSHVNFGLVTFNLSTLKPVKLTKDEIPIGKLKDYLMASATCFPAFKKKNIDDNNYIDGGYYDNLPINLAIEMGAEEVIAVDLGTLGFKRHIKNKNVKITYIAPRNNLGSFLVFHKDLSRRGIRFGYNDAMKTFNQLDGNKFTFKHNHLNSNFIHYVDIYKETLDSLFQKKNNKIIIQLLKITAYKEDVSEHNFNKVIESLGKIFEIDDSCIYDISRFNRLLIYKLDAMPSIDKKLIEQRIKNSDLKNLINSKLIIKYIYDKILVHTNSRIKNELSSIALLLPNELLSALYLYVIKNYN